MLFLLVQSTVSLDTNHIYHLYSTELNYNIFYFPFTIANFMGL